MSLIQRPYDQRTAVQLICPNGHAIGSDEAAHSDVAWCDAASVFLHAFLCVCACDRAGTQTSRVPAGVPPDSSKRLEYEYVA